MLMERAAYKPLPFERTHELTKAPIRLKDGSTLSAAEIADRFYSSEFGLAMSEQPLRYVARFGYDRDSMNDDLGHDLCPVRHQVELAYHVGEVLEAEINNGTLYGSLADEEIGIVMLASMLHDIGESTHPAIIAAGLNPVGDIPAGSKTDQNRADETAIRNFFYELLLGDVDDDTIRRIEAIISHSDKTLLHDLFDAGHVVQTVETTNFAYHTLANERWYRNGEVIDINHPDSERISGLLGIARVPYQRSLHELQEYSYFSHVREIYEKSEVLRNPRHQLLNSLY